MARSLEEIKARIRELEFREEFDLVVAVANGGLIPAALVNQRLGVEFQMVKFSLRDASQHPMYEAPKLVEEVRFDFRGRRILLVEDRVKTGATLDRARRLLETEAALVRTLAVNGRADYSLFDEPCFRFPWLL